MSLLFDTHAFIWWDNEPERLSLRVRSLCADPANEVFFSVASAWEMQIKIQLGKLLIRMPLQYVITDQVNGGLRVLQVSLLHVFGLQQLPRHHGDPFDQLLIAQARTEGMSLISHDHVFSQYQVDLIW
jgi:PIN domain nuclease of toxin-antitoxin system